MSHITPAIFFAHGSPMNIITPSKYSQDIQQYRKKLDAPKAIIVFSSHYLSRDKILVTSHSQPRQIFDFYGFPEALYNISYQPNGAPELAKKIVGMLGSDAKEDENSGLDHAVWAAGYFLFPQANIPIISISVPMNFSIAQLFNIGKSLQPLRGEGVMIIGSGNVVHNFQYMYEDLETFEHPNALEFQKISQEVAYNPSIEVLEKLTKHPLFSFAAPSLDHFAPFAMILGTIRNGIDTPSLIHAGVQNASMSMLSIEWR